MAGKSTYIRQVALITLLAQVGCWVPAKSCRIGLVDRIFSRVGASDDLARGNSTFMVEMNETANILNNATDRSLIILDEIGRGTSTYDGLSIAWAVVEHLHREPERGPRTLFATHYQELTQLEKHLPRLRNFSVAVKEWNDEIVFVRRVIPGAADRSYGIQVARLAGTAAERHRSREDDPRETGKRRHARLASAPAGQAEEEDHGRARGRLAAEFAVERPYDGRGLHPISRSRSALDRGVKAPRSHETICFAPHVFAPTSQCPQLFRLRDGFRQHVGRERLLRIVADAVARTRRALRCTGRPRRTRPRRARTPGTYDALPTECDGSTTTGAQVFSFSSGVMLSSG